MKAWHRCCITWFLQIAVSGVTCVVAPRSTRPLVFPGQIDGIEIADADNDFPGDSWTGGGSPQCDPANICHAPDSLYPRQVVLDAVQKSAGSLFISMLKKPPSQDVDLELLEGSLRSGGSTQANICPTVTRTVSPKAAKNTEGLFRWIVNDEEKEYFQIITTSVCKDAGSVCGKSHAFSFPGILTSCSQEYTEHKLLALDPKGRELIVDSFRFPSCCSCLVISNLEL